MIARCGAGVALCVTCGHGAGPGDLRVLPEESGGKCSTSKRGWGVVGGDDGYSG